MFSGFRGTASAIALMVMAVAPAAQAAVYVGSYQVDQGPLWSTNPQVLSAVEAAALLFGGAPGDYAVSTVDSNPANINNRGWYSTWGIAGGSSFAATFKLDLGTPGYNAPGGEGSAISAFVDDNALGPQFTNYVFRVSAPAVPEPGTWVLLIAGMATLGGALRIGRRRPGRQVPRLA